MKSLRVVAVLSVVCLLIGVASGQEAKAGPLAESPVYQKNCAKCHGKTATGRHFGGPALNADKVTNATVDDLRNIITNGKGRMPKYAGKLSPEEIDVLAQQISAFANMRK